jgi:pimeloyl-ACP methyl ester carboxylesterase
MADGQAVRGEGRFFAGGSAAVIFVHGFGSTRQGEKATALAAECARRGWSYAACDFRGHGASGGSMLELRGSRLLEDLEAITRLVMARTGARPCLVGSSMGGWAAAWFAARSPGRVAACAFFAPAFHFLEWRRLNLAERENWQRTGRLRVRNEFVDLEIGYGLAAEADEFKFADLTAQFRSPLMIFHGMRDDLVPYAGSVEFAARCAAADVELVLIKQGDHRLNREKERLARAACDFFSRFFP